MLVRTLQLMVLHHLFNYNNFSICVYDALGLDDTHALVGKGSTSDCIELTPLCIEESQEYTKMICLAEEQGI